MLLSGFGGQNQRGREIPRLVFLFLGDCWGMVGVLLSLSMFSRFGGRGVVWAALPASACPGLMRGGAWLWGLGGCQEGWWRASLAFCGRLSGIGAALTKPLYVYFSPSSFCADAGEETGSPVKGKAAPLHSWLGSPLANPTGFPAHGGTGIQAAVGLSPALPPGDPKRVQDLPPRTDLSFSCLFLLSPPFSPCCHPFSPPLPLPWQGFAGDLRSLPQLPPCKCQFLGGFVLSRDEKVLNAALNGSRWPKTSKKNEQNPFLFCTENSCHCPGHGTRGHTLPGADGCRNPSGEKPSWFLSIPLNCKLRGGEGEIMKFLIKKKIIKVCIYIYVVTI